MVTLEASRDNTLYESDSGTTSNGRGPFLHVGRAGANGDNGVRRAVIAFDIAANLPAGAVVTGARLVLHLSRESARDSFSPPFPFTLHRLIVDWGEAGSNAGTRGGDGAVAQPGDATWLHNFFDTARWSSPGGDFAAAPSAVTDVGDEQFPEWGPSAAMTADLQLWLDDPNQNFGWILIGSEIDTSTAKRFESRDDADDTVRPRLMVEFEIAADTPTATVVSATPTATPTLGPCVGDCDGNGSINIAELVRGVNIALGQLPLGGCPSMDADDSGSVGIAELIRAVNSALGLCVTA
jgi:hypothetical protein